MQDLNNQTSLIRRMIHVQCVVQCTWCAHGCKNFMRSTINSPINELTSVAQEGEDTTCAVDGLVSSREGTSAGHTSGDGEEF